MAETMAEILSPLFLPFVRQKYLSARQKTNTDYDMDVFNNLITNTKDYFSILSINIQSINAKFHELETLIESLRNVQLYMLASYACKHA